MTTSTGPEQPLSPDPSTMADLDLTPRSPAPGDPGESSRRRRRPWLPIVVLAAVLVAGGVIVTQFLRSAVDYYCNVDEVGVRDGCDADRRIRLQGTVDEGSVVRDGSDTEFTISFNGATMPVHYRGEPGGIFKECIPVVVHGVIEQGELQGDRVEVKHSDEYVSVNDERVADAERAGCDGGAPASASEA
jgi:cytochrome c-type biogenesis protein CcmE